MKRSAALVALSREHHGALSLALHARRASQVGGEQVAAQAARVVAAWRAELKPHFDEEERWLLPALARFGEHQLVARTLADHTELTRLVACLAKPDGATLAAFAEALTQHVRFEERELFPAAERHPGCLG
ncbi:MAG: hemerythrin domain-containing protein [Rhodocyclaceae bacterium]|nr:hemerythrin domain-containing protein [Rhodocyclaceae bacterium]